MERVMGAYSVKANIFIYFLHQDAEWKNVQRKKGGTVYEKETGKRAAVCRHDRIYGRRMRQ